MILSFCVIVVSFSAEVSFVEILQKYDKDPLQVTIKNGSFTWSTNRVPTPLKRHAKVHCSKKNLYPVTVIKESVKRNTQE